MDKEFVPHEQALALKELGFDEPCFAKYTVIPEDEIDWFTIPEQGITDKTSFGSSKNYNSKSFEEEGTISAPTFSQAFRWFREKYKLFHNTLSLDEYRQDVWWECKIYGKTKNRRDIMCQPASTHEEAELACLSKLIKLIKNKLL